MQSVARPVYSYLESLYPSGEDATNEEREAAKDVQQTSARTLFDEVESQFNPPRARQKTSLVNVQYKVQRRRLDAVREHLAKPNMSAAEIGKHAFEYFMENEEIE
jgi:hypothetical protein